MAYIEFRPLASACPPTKAKLNRQRSTNSILIGTFFILPLGLRVGAWSWAVKLEKR